MPDKHRRTDAALTGGQAWARDELRRIAAEYPDSLTLLEEQLGADGLLRVTIRLPTGDLVVAPGGLPVEPTEDVVVTVHPEFPRRVPVASVTHMRFADCAHVLQGERLCVYLDPDREWHPDKGVAGYLYALWQWFEDAAAGRFDPATALFHPVGGVLHETPGSSTVVVRQDLPPGAPVRQAYLTRRTPTRLDLHWNRPETPSDVAALIVTPQRLPFGAQLSLGGILDALAHAGCNRGRVLTAFAACARRNPSAERQAFVLAVPNPATATHFLLAGRVDAATTSALRDATGGPIVTINPATLNPNSPIEWCAMSDERPEITIRRDAERPVRSLHGRTVHLWGCGGIGSWIAEFVVRAGASRVFLSDPGKVNGGRLVRQNYTEEDVGENKAEALARRLQTLADTTEIKVIDNSVPESAALTDVDLIIDATVNLSVGHMLDEYARGRGAVGPTIASAAIDAQSASLGLLIIAHNDYGAGPATIDRLTEASVVGDVARYHSLWEPPPPGAELIPARGCSTPTFHGSAADLAGVAGVLANLLGEQLTTPSNGTHLFALPSAAGPGPAATFISAPPAD